MTKGTEPPLHRFLVLGNETGQYSVRPAFAEVPRGWTVAFGADTRRNCLDFLVSRHPVSPEGGARRSV
ncbi:MbtH family NRPS accessory protein [Actinoalloteichus spitiensis]|uniref:MbtH family NRPS accessory protein n=1 Tax=Actinoalloteichus spitiensis TaxID=252394 RepID=UPI00037F9ADB|nr:MbtH family NRPS accessory protein [Actinoalloteichus spitiensis]